MGITWFAVQGSQGQNKVSASLEAYLEAWGKNSVPSSFRRLAAGLRSLYLAGGYSLQLEVTPIPYHMAPSIVKPEKVLSPYDLNLSRVLFYCQLEQVLCFEGLM